MHTYYGQTDGIFLSDLLNVILILCVPLLLAQQLDRHFRDGVIATVCILVLLILAALLGVYVYRKRHKLAKHLDQHLRRRRSGQDPTNLYIGSRRDYSYGYIGHFCPIQHRRSALYVQQ